MKVTEVKTYVVDNVKPFIGGRQFLFVQLLTDEGIVGWGERPSGHAPNLKSHIELIHALCEQYLIGQSPFHIESMWQRAYGSIHDYRHPSLFMTPALSAIEMACWDIVGKATNQPIYELLGGRYHEKLRAYAYMPAGGIWENPAKARDVANQLLEEGNTACKLDPFNPISPIPRDFTLSTINHAASIFEHIRDEVGDRLEIGIGTHGQFSAAGAIRVANIFEQFHPMWFEEPVPPENIEEMARVSAQINIPVATGERLVSKYEFAQLVEKKAASIIQLDVAQCGGILESKKIAGIAEAHYALIAPHMYVGPIAAAAAVQLDTCSPNFMIQEYNGGPLHEELFHEPVKFADGFIEPPTTPGLGLEMNETVLKRQLSPDYH